MLKNERTFVGQKPPLPENIAFVMRAGEPCCRIVVAPPDCRVVPAIPQEVEEARKRLAAKKQLKLSLWARIKCALHLLTAGQ